MKTVFIAIIIFAFASFGGCGALRKADHILDATQNKINKWTIKAQELTDPLPLPFKLPDMNNPRQTTDQSMQWINRMVVSNLPSHVQVELFIRSDSTTSMATVSKGKASFEVEPDLQGICTFTIRGVQYTFPVWTSCNYRFSKGQLIKTTCASEVI